VRRLLLSLAAMWVGIVTLAGIATLVFGSFFSFLGWLLGGVLAIAFGMLLSAPFFLSPPADLSLGTVKLWVPALQFPWIAWIFKTLSWTGWWVLRGLWWLVHRGRSTTAPPGNSVTPQ
jgi:hypothetical protein